LICGVARPFEHGPLARLRQQAEQRLAERYCSIRLSSLSDEHSQQLLQMLMSAPQIPPRVSEQITARAAGVPLYLEEILRMLIDDGLLRRVGGQWRVAPEAEAAQLRVPDTLQGLILTRFDRLPELPRRVLQTASVIGRQFERSMLAAVLPDIQAAELLQALALLEQREFIAAVEGREAHEFRHALVSDAIYGTLLRRDRTELHGQVGQAIEQLYADRLEEHVEVLARHFGWSDHLDRALRYLIWAGQKARRIYANEQALQYFQQAVALLPRVPHLPEQELETAIGLGEVLAFTGDYDQARQHYQAALNLLDAHSADPVLGQRRNVERSGLLRRMARTHERQGHHELALQGLTAAREALAQTHSLRPLETAEIMQDLALLHFRRGDLEPARRLLQDALGLVEGTPAYATVASIYNRLGGIAHAQNDWALAALYVRKSIALRESLGDSVELATSIGNLGALETEMGEYASALSNLTRCLELKRRQGQTEGIAIALNNLGLVHVRRGELEAGRQALAEALTLARQIRYTSLLGQVHQNLAELHLAAQAWPEARESLQQALDVYRGLDPGEDLLSVFRLLGEVALEEERLPEAQAWQAEGESLLSKLGSRAGALSPVQRVEWLRFQGMLAGRRGETLAAQALLRESERLAIPVGNRHYLGRLAFERGRQAARAAEQQRARQHYGEAALLLNSVGARLEAQRAEAAQRALAPALPTYRFHTPPP
jgi:predicted ATPase